MRILKPRNTNIAQDGGDAARRQGEHPVEVRSGAIVDDHDARPRQCFGQLIEQGHKPEIRSIGRDHDDHGALTAGRKECRRCHVPCHGPEGC